jgi:hypothetical protein
MVYTLTDLRVSRVLGCLCDMRRKTLKEVTGEYNRRYPPSRIHKVIGIETRTQHIYPILKFLIAQGLVTKELFSFTDRPLITPEHLYFLTQEGIRYVGAKH